MKKILIIAGVALVSLLAFFISTSTPAPNGVGALDVEEERKDKHHQVSKNKTVAVKPLERIEVEPEKPRGSHQGPVDIKEPALILHAKIEELSEYHGPYKSFVKLQLDKCTAVTGFDTTLNRVIENDCHDINLELGEQRITIRITTCQDGVQPLDHIKLLQSLISSGNIGFLGEDFGIDIGDYSFVNNAQATNRILFVRGNVYCRIKGNNLSPGTITSLANEIDRQIQETKE